MKTLCVVALFSLLGACGYQLKSAVKLDTEYNKTYIQHAITAPIYRPLSQELASQGLRLVDSGAEATARIVIVKDNLEKQIQSIGTNNRVQEYRLEYELTFMVEYPNEVRIPEQSLFLSRDYAFDIGQITGTQAEEQVLREQLYQDMAQMIIRTIANYK
jgi:LPS-assembly lipoprotein